MDNGRIFEEQVVQSLSRLSDRIEAQLGESEKRIRGDLQQVDEKMQQVAKIFQIPSRVVSSIDIPSPVAH